MILFVVFLLASDYIKAFFTYDITKSGRIYLFWSDVFHHTDQLVVGYVCTD